MPCQNIRNVELTVDIHIGTRNSSTDIRIDWVEISVNVSAEIGIKIGKLTPHRTIAGVILNNTFICFRNPAQAMLGQWWCYRLTIVTYEYNDIIAVVCYGSYCYDKFNVNVRVLAVSRYAVAAIQTNYTSVDQLRQDIIGITASKCCGTCDVGHVSSCVRYVTAAQACCIVIQKERQTEL